MQIDAFYAANRFLLHTQSRPVDEQVSLFTNLAPEQQAELNLYLEICRTPYTLTHTVNDVLIFEAFVEQPDPNNMPI